MNLKKFREQNGLSQSQLAKKADIPVRLIQAYEQGETDIKKASVINALKLAKALEVTVEELILKD